ncbi:MAG: lytic transglycosylase domain-containing protein [Thermovirgaceae bacterium]
MKNFSGFAPSGVREVQMRIGAIRRRFGEPEKERERSFVDVFDAAGSKKTRQTADNPASTRKTRETAGANVLKETDLGRERPDAPQTDLEDLVRQKARAYGVDADLVRAVVRMESGGNTRAVSTAGAMGLMQLMPGTAEMLGVDDPFDPVQNVDGGVRYLKMMLDRYDGDETLALAAYHSGPGRVDRYSGVPPYPKVTHYVKSVKALLRRAREE